jgi:integrase
MKMSDNALAQSTRKSYDFWIKDYFTKIPDIEGAPPAEPITLESIQCYLAHLSLDCNFTYNSLLLVIASFAHKLRFENLDGVTKSMPFTIFKSGLRRTLKGDKPLNAKNPILPEHFCAMLQVAPPITAAMRETYFLMSMLYFGFLRLSEALALSQNDLILNYPTLTINLVQSKTDQNGKSEQIRNTGNDKPYSVFKFISHLQSIPEGQKIFTKTAKTYTRRMRDLFEQIGLGRQFPTSSKHSNFTFL